MKTTVASLKECRECGFIGDPLTDFYKDSQKSDGRTLYCKPCINRRQEHRRATCPEYLISQRNTSWRYTLRTKYNMTEGDYYALLESQGGVCAICGATPGDKKFPVDHDHESGLIRGILCDPCNKGLGCFADDRERMAVAIDYLRRG